MLPITDRKLSKVAKSLGLRFNATGRLLDMCADMMAVTAMSMWPLRSKGYARLKASEVRAIRKSKDKIAVIALENKISEAMVMNIRQRKCYKWVR